MREIDYTGIDWIFTTPAGMELATEVVISWEFGANAALKSPFCPACPLVKVDATGKL
jgi:hypothetical protein